MKSKKSFDTMTFSITSLFVAIIILMAFTPIGYLQLGLIKATIITIPVILGSIILGPKIGGLLGLLFGFTSLISNTFMPVLLSFAFSPFIPIPGTENGSILALVVCFLPRILVGIVPYYVFTFLQKLTKGNIKFEAISLSIAGIAGAMINTLLVMHLIFFLFQDAYASVKEVSVQVLYGAVLSVIGTIGIPEALIAAVVTAAVGKALLHYKKRGSVEGRSIMVLLVDTGNTTINLALLEENKLSKPLSFRTRDDFSLLKKWFLDNGRNIDNCLMSSVVPDQSLIISQIIEETIGLKPILVNIAFKSNLKIELENVETLGNDRFVNSVAAQSIYPNCDLLIIDFGTAITYDYINKEGILKFGLIALGIESTLESLSKNTAQLPKVTMGSIASIQGKNTKESIATGLYYSKIGEINHIVNTIKQELAINNLLVIGTGGHASYIAQGTKLINKVEANLIFKGLEILYKENINKEIIQ